MAQTKTLSAVKNLVPRLMPNWERISPTTGQTEYTQWAFKISGVGTDNAGTKEKYTEVNTYGTWQSTPYTDKELYTYIKNATTLHNVISGDLKTFYQNLINEDIST